MPGSSFGKMFINAVVGAVAGQWVATFKTELAIAKVEMKYKSKQLGAGAAMLAVAAVLGFFLLAILLAAAVLGLAVVFEPWLAALMVAGVLLLFVLIFGLIGRSKINKGKDLMPTASIERIKKQF